MINKCTNGTTNIDRLVVRKTNMDRLTGGQTNMDKKTDCSVDKQISRQTDGFTDRLKN